jgi:2-dehydropantoate 2-reductase
VIVTCKSYDLDTAIEAAAPHMTAGTGLALPLLNGMAHIDVLRARFGRDRVLGGLCGIFATLSPAGEVVQMAGLPPRLSFGRFKDQIERGVLETHAGAVERMMARPTSPASASRPIEQGLWEKWVAIATLAAGTCLMRASVGAIVSADDGTAIMQELLAEVTAVASAAGYAPNEQYVATVRGVVTAAGSDVTASMFRDIQGGGAIEGGHIVGDLLRRARSLRRGDAAAAHRQRASASL